MLDYTVVATQKTVSDLKRISLIFTISTQVLYIGYLIYALVLKLGFTWLNITLLSVSSLYFVFFLIVNGKSGKRIKEARKNLKHGYKIVKISASSFNLAVLLYSIYAFPEDVKPISVVLASLMTVVWVLQLVLELIVIFAERRTELFITALKADLETVTKPINSAQNFVRRIRGEEVIENTDEPTRIRKMLDQRVSERRAEKEVKKRDVKEKLVDFVFGKKRIKSDTSDNANETSNSEENEFAEK